MNTKVKNMLYCALFACLIAILAQIQIALPTLVPITLQTLGVYLVSLLLKPKLAFISTLVYVFMGAIGLPVFGGFSGD
ncbi:biotin transporter BioY [Coprobacillaceae bacterium CR2/5/TPMF4]|nr:biotin transporter BioY [Coprobacillaceae bacterium CR2/5/TPMF4]